MAFSGTVRDPDTGEEFTEPSMNRDVVTGKSISKSALPSRFDSPDYRILLVAEKYQTGFDQPLLQAMYVDKRLDGVQAVQTLSRLNRVVSAKEPPFVLDFVNDPENIRLAFAPYYDRTELLAASDPHQLEALKHQLNAMQVYHQTEVWKRSRESSTCPLRSGAQMTMPASKRSCSPQLTVLRSWTRTESVSRPPGRVCEPLRVPEPDHPLQR